MMIPSHDSFIVACSGNLSDNLSMEDIHERLQRKIESKCKEFIRCGWEILNISHSAIMTSYPLSANGTNMTHFYSVSAMIHVVRFDREEEEIDDGEETQEED